MEPPGNSKVAEGIPSKVAGQFGRGYQFHKGNIPDENITKTTLEEVGINPKLSFDVEEIGIGLDRRTTV